MNTIRTLAPTVIVVVLSAAACKHQPTLGFTADVKAAIEKGYVATLKSLISEGVDVNAHDDLGDTPLTVAARSSGTEGTVKLLLDEGAKVDLTDKGGTTPLMYAAYKGNESATTLLLKAGANPNLRDPEGVTALDYAFRRSDGCKVSLDLLQAGADVNSSTAPHEYPLSNAGRMPHSQCKDELFDELLRRQGTTSREDAAVALAKLISLHDVRNARNMVNAGTKAAGELGQRLLNSQLMEAASQGNTEEVQLLLKAGSDPNYLSNSKNPLEVAVIGACVGMGRGNDYVGTVKALLDAGSSGQRAYDFVGSSVDHRGCRGSEGLMRSIDIEFNKTAE